ncbi:MAG: HAMP domain-containing histidine kinase [Lachnospiraceae bacterium]|nr:HAMP domain-containing histidine kinase [Lachnospiraceae bacterium]
MRKKKKGIFTKLMISFFIFTILAIGIFVGSLVAVSVGIGGNSTPGINVYGIPDQNGKIGSLQGVSRIGGWIEKLDADYQVVDSWGDKQTQNRSYTKKEFSELLAASGGSTMDYIGYMTYRLEQGQDFYYVTILPRTAVKTDITIILNGISTWNVVFGVLFFGLFLLLCIVMSYYLSSTIRKPLSSLSEGMERVRLGEEGVRLLFPAKAEFADIKDTFNMMMERLEGEKAAKIQNEQKKNRLLLDLSHDIKTPMATIKSYANALEADLVPESDKRNVYKTIDAKANRVSRLMEDMFMMLKLNSTEYALHIVRTDISEFLRQICVEYYEEIEEKGFEFAIDIPDKQVEAEIDPKLLERVITNLLHNAVKYNKTGGGIGVSLKSSTALEREEIKTENNSQAKAIVFHERNVGGYIVIEVTDDGEEISSDIQTRLFDAFSRGDQARKTDGGTGLGLSIAKTIVEKHGGQLSYCRRKETNCFVICLKGASER